MPSSMAAKLNKLSVRSGLYKVMLLQLLEALSVKVTVYFDTMSVIALSALYAVLILFNLQSV